MGINDLEKADVHSTSTDLAPNDNGWTQETKSGSRLSRMRDSFKRNANARMVTEAVDDEGRPLPDQPAAQPALSMALKDRHLQMIAIGGSIGAQIICHLTALTISYRHWTFCRLRSSSFKGRAWITDSLLWPCRNYAILHRSSAR